MLAGNESTVRKTGCTQCICYFGFEALPAALAARKLWERGSSYRPWFSNVRFGTFFHLPFGATRSFLVAGMSGVAKLRLGGDRLYLCLHTAIRVAVCNYLKGLSALSLLLSAISYMRCEPAPYYSRGRLWLQVHIILSLRRSEKQYVLAMARYK